MIYEYIFNISIDMKYEDNSVFETIVNCFITLKEMHFDKHTYLQLVN